MQETLVSPGLRKIPCRRKWQPIPVFLSGKFHGQRSLAGYSPWGRRVRHNLATEHRHNKLRDVTVFYATKISAALPLNRPRRWWKLNSETNRVGLPWWLSGKESACQCGITGLIPGPGRSHLPSST